ncbi:DJ-1/PfpI family protein [Streptomyces sp. NBC_00161]|uniref:DJ-1/PfpI family protein n=1 Tax=Streptomyces sp. NBC_00161 TaxID=2975671 RepID=UPI00324A7B64
MWNFLPLSVTTLDAVHTWSTTQPCAAGPSSRYTASFSRHREDRRHCDPLGPREEDPPFDVLVIPGGVTTSVETDTDVIDWLARRRQTSALTFSICAGAFLLAATGALDGRPATTHWEDQEELAQRWPDIQVRTDVRWVDDGDIVTSAGISASLHIVGRLFGWQLARRTALQMEYDWTGEHTAEAGI